MVWPLLQYINFKFVPLPVYICVLAFYLVSIVPGSLYQHFCFLLEHLFVPISKQKCSKARLSVFFSWFWSSYFLMNYFTMFYWWSAIIFLMIWYIWLVCCKIELKHEDSLIITDLVDCRCVKKERFIAYTSLSSKQSQRKWVFFCPSNWRISTIIPPNLKEISFHYSFAYSFTNWTFIVWILLF